MGALLLPLRLQSIYDYCNAILMFEHAKDVTVTGGSMTEIHGDSHTYGQFQLVCRPHAMLTLIVM